MRRWRSSPHALGAPRVCADRLRTAGTRMNHLSQLDMAGSRFEVGVGHPAQGGGGQFFEITLRDGRIRILHMEAHRIAAVDRMFRPGLPRYSGRPTRPLTPTWILLALCIARPRRRRRGRRTDPTARGSSGRCDPQSGATCAPWRVSPPLPEPRRDADSGLGWPLRSPISPSWRGRSRGVGKHRWVARWTNPRPSASRLRLPAIFGAGVAPEPVRQRLGPSALAAHQKKTGCAEVLDRTIKTRDPSARLMT